MLEGLSVTVGDNAAFESYINCNTRITNVLVAL